MIQSFAQVLNSQERVAVNDAVAHASFVDGRATAGPRLADIKHNQQIAANSPELPRIQALVLDALKRHEAFRLATYPRHLHSLMVSRYTRGMSYGAHVDEALMGAGSAHRTDLSITLFLSEPQDYDGGELALETGSGEIQIKLPAGDLVCYPTGQWHQVREITRGERRVIVAWIESFVPDIAARETLWDLAQAREALFAQQGKSRAYELVNKAHANLLRRWART